MPGAILEQESMEQLISRFEGLCNELTQRSLTCPDAQRQQALNTAQKLVRKLQSPNEFGTAQSWAPLEIVGAAIACDLDIPNTIAAHNGPIQLKEIAEKTPSAAEVLVMRIVRFLAGHGMIDQLDEEVYVANDLTRDYATDVRRAQIFKMLYCLPSYAALPAFLRETGYRDSSDPKNCAWQKGLQTTDTFWQWLDKRPMEANWFNTLMTAARSANDDSLAKTYPFSKLFAGAQHDDVLFVDVGGGYGQQCINIRASFPKDHGRVVLQDLESVVKGRELADVEVQAYDMFEEQPIKGAKAYYLRGICHDHSDEVCRRFLARVKAAMTEDSRILIHERLVADINPTDLVTKSDFMMMAQFAAMERSYKQIKTLLESVGFKVGDQYRLGVNEWSIVEATV
ncbi:Hypothetical protein R9X50_00416100 [Acrodontium crateriforme]|uniref:O-methyltransferase n=1 Tax=Acrodontium crateriforme TaxID=150365 RepID=A0AAQ3MAI8_9PEZI|nr:Hypothetical protein R9X50_00416100 [Acrodontium crateriforme]